MRPIKMFQKYAVRLVALVVIASLYGFARLPELSGQERQQLASQFKFVATPLPGPGGVQKTIRAVHPSLEHIAGWISSVGAAIALNDIDGDGLANDVCLVDPRSDEVLVTPVPGTPQRYKTIVLTAEPLPYEAITTAPMGCLPGDVNEDGALDLLVYYWGRTPVIFLQSTMTLHSRSLRFTPHELTQTGDRWFTNAATFADLDGDGLVDLVFGNYFQDNARILDAEADGREEMQDSMTRALNAGRNRLFLWKSASQAGIQFQEAEDVLDKETMYGWTLAVGAADLNDDLLPELYFANDFGSDRLLYNQSQPGQLKFRRLEGSKRFTTPNSKVLGRDSFKGMGVDFADLNGDGLLDIFVSNIATEFALEESHFAFMSTGQTDAMDKGIAPYLDQSEGLGLSRSNWSWDAKFADFNNDGVLELLQATGFLKGETNRWPELQELAMGNDLLLKHPQSWPRFQPGDDLSGSVQNPFFVRAKNGRYYDLSKDLGIGTQVARGLATADVDGDGDMDFASANQWDTSYVYRNDCSECGAFLDLTLLISRENNKTQLHSGFLQRPQAAYAAVGAHVEVQVGDKTFVAQVDGGNGHSGARSYEVHVGLGKLPTSSKLEVSVRWRNPTGHINLETLHLTPGVYTVLLGTNSSLEE